MCDFLSVLQNPILNCDSYKISHYKQYPSDTEYLYSYIESRGGRWQHTLFFGLQMFIKEYLLRPITAEMIDEAEKFSLAHIGMFNREDWEYILNEHGGYLPVLIKAPPEGSLIPTSNVLVDVINTDPKVPWITNYIETALQRAVWAPTTVATKSFKCKQIIRDFLKVTSEKLDVCLPFALHDFGARGTSSNESAALLGAAHLVNFMGSDTIAGVRAAMHYYDAEMPAFSVAASEHSTITSWGDELRAFENMIDKFGKPGVIFSCVSDSYDIYNAVENLWPSLKEKLINSGAKLVVRPDSGNPVAVVTSVTKRLMDKFGFERNSLGFDCLPPYIGVIQGDGIDERPLFDILQECKNQRISAQNVVFGMGSGLLQHFNRDTLKFAMKCSAIKRNGGWFDVFKDPITDPGKRSKKGVLALVKTPTGFETRRASEELKSDQEMFFFRPVYSKTKGSPVYASFSTFKEIRERAESYL